MFTSYKRCKVDITEYPVSEASRQPELEQACSEFRAFASNKCDTSCIEVTESDVVSDQRFASRHIPV
jgi:hypothetical protein